MLATSRLSMFLSDLTTLLASSSDSSDPSYYLRCLSISIECPFSSRYMMLTAPVEVCMLFWPRQQKFLKRSQL